MNEAGARAITLLQAFETAEPPSPNWGDADRAWATRAAREADAPAPQIADTAARVRRRDAAGGLLERRAQLALQRLATREPGVAIEVLPGRLPGRWLVAALGVAFVAGLAADAIGSGQRINLLAPPLWGVLAWNVAVYLGLLAAAVAAPGRASSWAARPGSWRARVLRLLANRPGIGGSAQIPGSAAAWRLFGSLWFARRLPLLRARLTMALHVAAAVFAAGLIAGLYLRGLVLDYRAAWESTFLDAHTVRNALAVLLSPASALTGIGVPDEAVLAAMRDTRSGLAAGASAAPWIHLFAALLVLVVVLPRLALAALEAGRSGWMSRRFPLVIAGEPYLERLARDVVGRAAYVLALPYAALPGADAAARLRDALREPLGDDVVVEVGARTAYGDEDTLPARFDPSVTHRLALFDLAATPEPEVHGRFARALAAAAPAGSPTLLVVDEAAFRRRFGRDTVRLAERRAAWSTHAAALGSVPVFIDLGNDAVPAGSGWADALRAPVEAGSR